MPERSDVVYIYDGSLEGLFCCIFESFNEKEVPVDVFSRADYCCSLYREKIVETDLNKFARVKNGLLDKCGEEVYSLIVSAYYSALDKKEMTICDFARIAFANGKKVMDAWGNQTVCAMLNAQKHLGSEAHLLKGFIRFSVYDGVMVSVIEPKNYVLPYISDHFCSRFHGETFMIYDKTHGCALVYRPHEQRIIEVDSFSEPEAGEEEQHYRKMWKTFYDTIAIKERENPVCRRSHMPMRYWTQMTEFREAESGSKQLYSGDR